MFNRETARIASLSLTAVAAIGCADVDPMTGEPGPDPDVASPVVVSSQPAPQATAVASDASIHITFSEPMDRATIEASYQSQLLPLDKVSMSWNADGTVLTIHPDAELIYAGGIGTDPTTVPAQVYAITLGAEAADLSGNVLGAPFELTFATKKRMEAAFTLQSSLTRVRVGGTLLGSSNDIWIGDNAVGSQYRAYLSFDLSALPAGIEIEAAEFSSRQLAPQGLPYQQLGAVMTHHVAYANLTDAMGALPAISQPGAYSMDDGGPKVLDVTSQVADDIANRTTRGGRTQYRLQMDTPTNGDDVVDKAIFSLATFSMAVTYIAD